MTEVSNTPPAPPKKRGILGGLAGLWFRVPLWQRILAALLAGGVAGYFWGPGAASIKWIGDLFVLLIRMAVIPLVMVTIVSGVAALGDARRLGSIGVKTLLLYLFTTAIAVTVGLTLGTLAQPGLGADFSAATPQVLNTTESVGLKITDVVPANVFKAMADGALLPTIFFSLLLGSAILTSGEKGRPIAALFESASEVMLKVVAIIMELAPFGVFALIATVMGTVGLKVFASIGVLALCVLGGSLFQTFIVHGLVIRLMAWLPVVPFFRGITDAMLVAFSTSSSSATLPVAMRVAEENLGIKPAVVSTALPLGTTVSMDGTALYIGLLAMFAAQAFGVQLSLEQYLLIGVTTVMVAVGTAPVPSASLFMLAGVLTTFGITPEQTAILVGFILPFDRILDMIRTVPNNTSDLAVATVVARWENEIDVEVYKSSKDV
ncbi:MAG: dicarboxylate/amino acid:cation symporter [Caulobacter sp.]|nr:dicarboxylate/amino acid:cation symporter [Caulobacter sp.]